MWEWLSIFLHGDISCDTILKLSRQNGSDDRVEISVSNGDRSECLWIVFEIPPYPEL